MIPRDMLLWREARVQVDAPVKRHRPKNQRANARQNPRWRTQASAFCAVVTATVLLMPQARAQSDTKTTDLGALQGTVSEAATLPRKIDSLAQQIYRSMLGEQKSKVAILPLGTLIGESTVLGLFIADKLTNALFVYRDKFEVVDRMHLDKILSELKLSQTGAIDPATVQQLGKLLGADAIVAGTITDLGTHVDVTIRLLGAEEGRVLAVASEQFLKDASIAQLLGVTIAPLAVNSDGMTKSAVAPSETQADDATLPIEIACTEDGLAACRVSSGTWRIETAELPNSEMGPVIVQNDANASTLLSKAIPHWKNFIVEFRFKYVVAKERGSITVYFGGRSVHDNYSLEMIVSGNGSVMSILSSQTNGASTKLGSKYNNYILGKAGKWPNETLFSKGWHTIRISVTDDRIVSNFDGVAMEVRRTPQVSAETGLIAFGTLMAKVQIAGVKVTPLN